MSSNSKLFRTSRREKGTPDSKLESFVRKKDLVTLPLFFQHYIMGDYTFWKRYYTRSPSSLYRTKNPKWELLGSSYRRFIARSIEL